MSDEPDSITLRMMRRIDAKLDRALDGLSDLKERVGAVETGLAGLSTSITGLSRRVDRVEARLDWIDRRLDLVEES